jgi:hypothetical protein
MLSEEWGTLAIGRCGASASQLAMTLKHESFEEEREWRLISQPKFISELEFRQGLSTLIPFFPFNLGSDRNSYLHSLIVGPTPLPELAVDSARMLLQKLGLSPSKEKVSGTKTPFRGW